MDDFKVKPTLILVQEQVILLLHAKLWEGITHPWLYAGSDKAPFKLG